MNENAFSIFNFDFDFFFHYSFRFCEEKRYSDYIVRELTLTATKASITKAANGSDLDVKTTETRTVKHYHYLQWKDFNAPEHAPAMLRFVKRINEDHLKSRYMIILPFDFKKHT